MTYYLWTPSKTTGPYSFQELEKILQAFPLKPGVKVLTECEYKVLKKIEENS